MYFFKSFSFVMLNVKNTISTGNKYNEFLMNLRYLFFILLISAQLSDNRII